MSDPSPAGFARATEIIAVVAVILFGYVALRAFLIPITWDEAYNYLEFTRQGRLLPLPPFGRMAANNHYLNTWLTWLTTSLFGVSELTLRLPALLAHGLFLYGTARLCRELSSPLLSVAGFVVLNGNPYMLDFFSLSRGYGLAYGLVAMSLWYLYRFFQRDLRTRDGLKSLALAVLAVSAHLTLVHFLLALAAVLVLATMLCAPVDLGPIRRLAYGLRANAVGLALVGLVLVPTLYLLVRLRRARALFYGGSTGFWEDTLLDSLHAWLYKRDYRALLDGSEGGAALPLFELLGGLALLLVAAAVWQSGRALWKRHAPSALYLPALVFLLVACAAVTIVQHHLMGVLYLKSRTSVHVMILGAYVAVVLADTMARQGRRSAWLPAAAVLVLLNLITTLNLNYVAEWRLGADIRQMLADVAAAQEAAPGGDRPVTIGIDRSFEAPINFYRVKDRLTWLNPADRRTKLHPLNDYYFLTEPDVRRLDPDSFVVLASYPLSGSRLLRRARPPGYELQWREAIAIDTPANGGSRRGLTDRHHPRSAELRNTPDLSRNGAEPALALASARVWMQDLHNATAQLVVAFERDGGVYWRTTTPVRDLVPGAQDWFPVHLSVLVPAEARPGDRIAAYVENTGTPAYVDHLELRWLTAKER